MGMLSDVALSRLRQYIIIITANLSILCVGMGSTWPSPVLVMLKNETTTPLSDLVTDEEGSWIVSIYFISALTTLIISSAFLNRIGKKQALLLGFFPRISSAFIYLFTNNFRMLLVGRILNGISDILAIVVVGPYAAEIASKEIRGSLGTITQILSCLGMLIMFSVGPNVTYFTLNLIFASIVIISFVPILLLPESPYYLYSRGHSDDAYAVLKLLCKSESAALTELNEYGTDVNVDIKALLRDKAFIKAMILGIVISQGTQLIGYDCVSYYMQTVLESTHVNIESGTSSMIVGILQLLGGIFSTVVIDRFGRKPTLISTLIGVALGMFGLGVFFTIRESNGDTTHGFLNYLPLLSMAIVVFCYISGAGASSQFLVAELMGNSYRMVGVSACTILSSVTLILLTKFFAALTSAIGSAAVFFICCTNCIIFCAFIAICVPETKNKSFKEIQRDLATSMCYVKCLNSTGE